MDLINFIKNLFKQKEDNLWIDPKTNSNNHILEINTLTGEVIIKGNTKETYSVEYWFPENK